MKRRFIAAILLLSVFGLPYEVPVVQAAVTETFTATGSYTAKATTATVECWGGGGSGGAATGNPSTGGGGAGGTYVSKAVTGLTVGNSYTVTVGTGGVATTSAGVAGNDSWFDSTSSVLAKGGAAGGTGSTNNGNGSGGTGSCTGCIGDTTNAGGSGGTGVVATPISGGGGGGAGTGGVGGNASVGTAGTGTATGGGNGGAGVAVANTRNAGSTLGGGGSGGYASGAADRSGGDGARGEVRVTYEPPPAAKRIIWIGLTFGVKELFSAETV